MIDLDKKRPWEDKDVVYTDDPSDLPDMENITIIENLLPENLVYKRRSVKITINMDADSLYFFKTQAKRLKTPYQRMIRNLLSQYATMHKNIFETDKK